MNLDIWDLNLKKNLKLKVRQENAIRSFLKHLANTKFILLEFFRDSCICITISKYFNCSINPTKLKYCLLFEV